MDITDDKRHDHFLSWPSIIKAIVMEDKEDQYIEVCGTFFAPGNESVVKRTVHKKIK